MPRPVGPRSIVCLSGFRVISVEFDSLTDQINALVNHGPIARTGCRDRLCENLCLQSVDDSFLQVLRDRRELLQRGLQVFGDLGSDNIGIRQVRAVFEAIVFEPEEVEVHLVALDQLFVGEGLPALALVRLVRSLAE